MFIYSILSFYAVFNSTNFQNIDLKNLNYPCFFHLYDNNEVSRLSYSQWAYVADNAEFNREVLFVDIDCGNFSDVCEHFPAQTALQYLWLDKGSDSFVQSRYVRINLSPPPMSMTGVLISWIPSGLYWIET